ncbi:MAG TPA: SHOCT domain-containing protein [Thermoanaerobaculia bacterium]|nr:SHOCT domain-containing protein [Thermoanaerobaculia bacterium]
MRKAILFAAVVLFGLSAHAQFWDKLTNPRVTVTLKHPPYLGLTVKRIAFAPIANAGDCADQFLDAVSTDFVGSGADVVDRQNLEAMLAEHRFNLTEFTDANQKAQLGKMLGPAALVFVKVLRCTPEKKQLTKDWSDKNGAHRNYISRTTVYFKASIRAVDLTTGTVLNSTPIDYTETRENTSVDACCAEYSSEFEVQDVALRKSVVDAHRMFFPWTENRELYFFDDEPCGLKTAFRLLKGGDQDGTLQQSETNLETCRTTTQKMKPKVMWHAHYNAGMAHFIAGNYDKALQHFTDAAGAGGGDIVAQSMSECRRAKQLAEEMRRVEERPPLDVAAAAPASPPPSRSASRKPEGLRAGDDMESKLRKLKTMLDKGLITKADYDKKKTEILNSF